MRTIPISAISIPPDRQRKEGKDSKSLTELKSDIAKFGLYHPPVLTEAHELVIGERRLLAMKELHEENVPFTHDGEPVPHGEIPFTLFSDALKTSQMQAELNENLIRLNLSWKEEALAKVAIHEALSKLNPGQTRLQTAKIILTSAGKVADEKSALSERKNLIQAKIVADHLSLPAVATAPNISKAYKAVLDLKQRELEKDLVSLRPKISPHQLLHADSTQELVKDIYNEAFDLIIADPPYGINANTQASGSSHRYDDSPEYALSFYNFLLSRGFHLLKPQGAIFLFCDIEHFLSLRTFAEQHAFSTFRTPIIWSKGAEGHAPWGRDGFKRTYEIALYAVKGQRPLVVNGGADVKTVIRPTSNPEKLHAAEKPPELLRWIIQLICRKGDKVLDPCCGSAPIFPAVKDLHLHITAIEKSPEYHAAAASRLLALDSEAAPEDHVLRKAAPSEILDDLLS